MLEYKKLAKAWPIFWLICTLEGLVVLVLLVSQPSEPGSRAFLGLSIFRWLMVLATAAGVFAFGLLTFASRKPSGRYGHIFLVDKHARIYAVVNFVCFFLAVIAWFSLEYMRLYPEGLYRSLYGRLLPLLGWLVLVCFQAFFWLLALRLGLHSTWFRQERARFIAILVAFGILVGGWFFIGMTRLGITPDPMVWNGPGVVVLEWQILTAWAIGAVILLLSVWLDRKFALQPRSRWIYDIVLGLLIWVTAVLVWNSQPIEMVVQSTFAPMRAPNHEIYPYSDAGFYDYTANSILIGEGYLNGRVVTRPLYILILAGMHAVGGQDYASVIFVQILVLALFPMVLYFLGNRLHSPGAGVMVGLLAIFRDVNSLLVTPYIRVSHTRLLLTEIPTALALGLICLALIKWWRRINDRLAPLAIGGLLGLVVLLRAQTAIFLPAVMVLALFLLRFKWRTWLSVSAALLIGFALGLGPWLGRSVALTGRPILEQQNQMIFVSSLYRFGDENQSFYELQPGEDEKAFNERLTGQMYRFIGQNPGYVSWFVSNHFLNNVIDNVLVLPLRQTNFTDITQALDLSGLFWERWNGNLKAVEGLQLGGYLLLIAVGLGAAWRKLRWAGLVPLFVCLVYAFSTALARNSGWRFALPADWCGYLYFSVGVLEVLSWMICLFGMVPEWEQTSWANIEIIANARYPWRQAFAFCALILLLGSSVVLVEKVVPRRFEEKSKEELISLVQPGLNSEDLIQLLKDKNSYIGQGRLLYPRYYPAGQGEPGSSPWAAYEARDYARLGFVLLHQGARGVVLPLEKAPKPVPNAANALVIGCIRPGYVEASALIFPGNKPVVLVRQGGVKKNCD
jgi:hypothetical protein